jgi:hypothetical protein
MAKAYGKGKEVIDTLVLQFKDSVCHSAEWHGRNQEGIRLSAYPIAMLSICDNHRTASSRSFNIENITHYLHLIMFGAYHSPTKNILTSITSGHHFLIPWSPSTFLDH